MHPCHDGWTGAQSNCKAPARPDRPAVDLRPAIVEVTARPGGAASLRDVRSPAGAGYTANERCQMAELSAKARDRLRSTQFAYVDSNGGEHLPINDESHIRNAIARFDQTEFESVAARQRARRKILVAARRHGIEVAEDSSVRARPHAARDPHASRTAGRPQGLTSRGLPSRSGCSWPLTDLLAGPLAGTARPGRRRRITPCGTEPSLRA